MVLRMLKPSVGLLDTRTAWPAAKRADRFYDSPAWRDLVKRIIAQRGRACEDPDHDRAKPRTGSRIYADHMQERSDGGAELDPDNVMLRCPRCHGKKTAEQARLRRQGGR